MIILRYNYNYKLELFEETTNEKKDKLVKTNIKTYNYKLQL